jgi:hypothetical protein
MESIKARRAFLGQNERAMFSTDPRLMRQNGRNTFTSRQLSRGGAVDKVTGWVSGLRCCFLGVMAGTLLCDRLSGESIKEKL